MPLHYDKLEALSSALSAFRSCRSKLADAIREVAVAFDETLATHDQDTPEAQLKAIRIYLAAIETKLGDLDDIAGAIYSDYYDETAPEDDPGDPLYCGPVDHMQEKCVR